MHLFWDTVWEVLNETRTLSLRCSVCVAEKLGDNCSKSLPLVILINSYFTVICFLCQESFSSLWWQCAYEPHNTKFDREIPARISLSWLKVTDFFFLRRRYHPLEGKISYIPDPGWKPQTIQCAWEDKSHARIEAIEVTKLRANYPRSLTHPPPISQFET